MKKVSIKNIIDSTGLGYKTILWLYQKHIIGIHDNLTSKYREFAEEDINVIKRMQIGIFDINHGLKKIEGYDLYWASPDGKIYTYKRKFFEECKPHIVHGYYYIGLFNRKTNKHNPLRLHRIIAKTFLDNPNNLPVVNHKNGIKTDNRIENLEWTTMSYNTKHAYDNGLAHNDKGIQDSQSYNIIVYYMNGTIKKFGSLSEAERLTGISKSTYSYILKQHSCSKKYNILKIIKSN